MKILSWSTIIEGLAPSLSVSATIGVFDGLHRGHQTLLRKTLEHPEAEPLVISFSQNPKKILSPDNYLGDLMTMEEKIAQLRIAGFRFALIIDFSLEFSKMSGWVFFETLKKSFQFKELVIGYDFSFGKNSGTQASDIQKLIDRETLLTIMPPVYEDSTVISSSEIRNAVVNGRFAWAKTLLGRPYQLRFEAGQLRKNEDGFSCDRSILRLAAPKWGNYEVLADGQPAFLVAEPGKLSLKTEQTDPPQVIIFS